ncbi:MAG: hypothetical protein AAFN11_13735, partial [Chloroflexota bacterium]
DFQAFPPRLDWQPIFYPVLNRAYALEIASKWNTKDTASDFVGIVTAFDVDDAYLSQFEPKTVGNGTHQELWIPAEKLATFNQKIAGAIRIVDVFYGDKYAGEKIETTA